MNSIYFDRSDVKKGLHKKFIDDLIEYGYLSDTYQNEIHIYNEDGAVIVEWFHIPHDNKKNEDGHFEQVRSDQQIFTEFSFPDRHYEWLPEDQYDERFAEWLEEEKNNGRIWIKNEYGIWTQKINKEEA